MKIDLDPDAVVGSLTVAKQQMVEIAKALLKNAKVLIMDEPTSRCLQRDYGAVSYFETAEDRRLQHCLYFIVWKNLRILLTASRSCAMGDISRK